MNRLENTHRYDDIIDLPHPVSKKASADAIGRPSRTVFSVCSIDRL